MPQGCVNVFSLTEAISVKESSQLIGLESGEGDTKVQLSFKVKMAIHRQDRSGKVRYREQEPDIQR